MGDAAAVMGLHPYLVRRIQCVTVLIIALGTTSSLAAQAPVAEGATQPWQLEGTLGVINRVPAGYGRAGVIVGAQGGAGSAMLRFVMAATYMRELGRGDVRCCGPNPGIRYAREAVVLGVGTEVRPLEIGTGALALDLQYNPTWYHTLRSGSQPDFTPPPTEWHRMAAMFSAGAAWRWRPARTLSARVGIRAYVNLTSVALDAGDGLAPLLAISASLGTP